MRKKGLKKGAENLLWVFFAASTVGIVALSLLIFADMAMRTAFDLSIEGGIEVSEYILVAIGFLGLGYAQLKGGHVAVDVLIFRFSPRVQRWVNILQLVVLIVFFVMMTLQIGKEAYIAWVEHEHRSGTTLLIPTWPAKFLAFMGSAMLVFAFLVQLVSKVFGSEGGETKGGGE